MRMSAEQNADYTWLRRKLLNHLGDGPRRLSTYRMLNSKQFLELCQYYMEGIGIRQFEQFAVMVRQLEKTFEP